MDEADFIDILEHLRELVRKAGLITVDDTASMQLRTLSSPKHRLETYLYITINVLKERSSSQTINTYDRFKRSLELEDGGTFSGVLVELNESEHEMYRMNKYWLEEMDDFSPVIIELQKILDEIKMEPEPPNNNFSKKPTL